MTTPNETPQNDFMDVAQFHAKFELPSYMTPDGLGTYEKPSLMTSDQLSFRLRFLREELKELDDAFGRRDLVEVVDSLIDFVYVTYGTALFMNAGPKLSLSVQWPTYFYVHQMSVAMGYRPQTMGSPGLPNRRLFNLLLSRMENHVDLFEDCHVETLSVATQFSLFHLYQAALEAYLMAALIDAPWLTCWTFVHAANMRKIRVPSADQSKRGSAWDVVKPEGWESPNPKIELALIAAGAML